MTRFWWVRHGPTHARTFVGWRDVAADLSDLRQIARLNAYLPQAAVLISSDLLRAVQTADVLAEGRLRLPHAAGLREFNFGDWDGKHYSEVTKSHPELSRNYWEKPGDIAPPNGESWNGVSARVADAVGRMAQDHPGRDVIVVAHAGVILTQVQRALGISAYAALAQKIDNLSVTAIQMTADRMTLQELNHIP